MCGLASSLVVDILRVIRVEIAGASTVVPLSALLAIAIAITQHDVPSVEGLSIRIGDINGIVVGIGIVPDILLLHANHRLLQVADIGIDNALGLHLGRE